jgi:hypothetical protein
MVWLDDEDDQEYRRGGRVVGIPNLACKIRVE